MKNEYINLLEIQSIVDFSIRNEFRIKLLDELKCKDLVKFIHWQRSLLETYKL